MIRQDYILRLIEQFIRVLTEAILKKEKKDYPAAINDIESGFKNILGIDFELLNSLSDENIISMLVLSDPSGVKCVIAGKLYRELIELENQNGGDKENLYYGYLKVLSLLSDGIIRSKSYNLNLSEYYKDTDEITEKLKGYKLPWELKVKLFRFYEATGQYDKAENLLFKLKDEDFRKIKEEGIRFYNRMILLTNDELQKGNLSLNEIKEGLKEFLIR